jgi:hypothetical protein
MNKKRWLAWLIVGAAIVVVGHVSNSLSRSAYLRDATFWYTKALLADQPFHLQLTDGQEEVRCILDCIEARYTVLTDEHDRNAYPRVSLRSWSALPFVASVNVQTLTNAHCEHGWTSRYLCLFGLVFSLGESFEVWPTPAAASN